MATGENEQAGGPRAHRRWPLAVLAVGLCMAAACVVPPVLPGDQSVVIEKEPEPCGDGTHFDVINHTPYPAHIDYIGDRGTHGPASVTSDVAVVPAGGRAHLVSGGTPFGFDLWYTLIGGPAPTSSSSPGGTGIAISGQRIAAADSVTFPSTPPSVASGIIQEYKFACVGSAIT